MRPVTARVDLATGLGDPADDQEQRRDRSGGIDGAASGNHWRVPTAETPTMRHIEELSEGSYMFRQDMASKSAAVEEYLERLWIPATVFAAGPVDSAIAPWAHVKARHHDPFNCSPVSPRQRRAIPAFSRGPCRT